MNIHKYNYNLKTIFRISIAVFLSCIAMVIVSCHKKNTKPTNYDAIFEEVYNIYNVGNKNEALPYLDSSFSKIQNLPPIVQFKIYNFKRIYYYYLKKYELSYTYSDSMLEVLEAHHEENNYKKEYSNALGVKADNYFEKNILNKAFEYYFKSRIIAESIGDTCTLSNINYHMGMITYRQGKYNDAIVFFKQSFKENENCSSDALTFCRSQELINNIALSYNKLNILDSALYYYHKALDFITKDKDRFAGTKDSYVEMAKGVVYGNLAKIYIMKNMPDSAKSLLNKSIAINMKPGNEKGDAMLEKMQLAELYYKTNELNAAFVLLNELKNMLDTVILRDVNNNVIDELQMRWNHVMYACYNKKNEPELALAYLENYEKIRDSLENANRELNTINVQQLLEYRETYNKNKVLLKDNKFESVFLLITIGFCICILIIIGLVLNNYYKTKKHVLKLTTLNQEILEQKSQVEEAVAQLEKNNEDKDRILYMVVHDLRTPVNGIIFLANMLTEVEMNTDQAENLEMIRGAAESCSTLINDLLEMSADHTYEESTKKSIEDVNELVKYVVNLMLFKTIEKKQTINVMLTDPGTKIIVNKEKLRRALSNLLTNAVKFSAVKAEIDVAIKRADKQITISIQDHGIGIPKSIQPFIFDMFTTAKRYGTSGEKSYGLGLSICKQIVEANNGKIWFVSKEGKGSCFFIQLPESD